MTLLVDAPGAHRTRDDATSPESGDGAPVGPMRWALRVLAWLVILGCLLVLAVTVVVPRLAGAAPYTVLTGSMAPQMPPGTLVVTREADAETIGIGTVVTYQLVSGQPAVVTHRVIAVQTTLDGDTEFQTQGDANPVPDQKWVKTEQIRGVKWYSVPFLGRVNVLLTGHQRQLTVYGVATGLVLYAGLMFAGAAGDRRRPAPEVGRHRI